LRQRPPREEQKGEGGHTAGTCRILAKGGRKNLRENELKERKFRKGGDSGRSINHPEHRRKKVSVRRGGGGKKGCGTKVSPGKKKLPCPNKRGGGYV